MPSLAFSISCSYVDFSAVPREFGSAIFCRFMARSPFQVCAIQYRRAITLTIALSQIFLCEARPLASK